MAIYIGALSSIIVCLLAWCLSLVGKLSDQKVQDKRKINRLVFNLLELKFWVEKELALELQLKRLMETYVRELENQQIAVSKEFHAEMSGKVSIQLKSLLSEGQQIPAIEDKLDEIVKDLSEVDPVFAFELKDKYKLTPHLLRAQQMIGGLAGTADKEIQARVLTELLRPRILADLAKELQENLPLLAKKAGRKVYKRYLTLAVPSTPEIDVVQINAFMGDYVKDLLQLAVENREV